MGAKLDNAVGLYLEGIRDGHVRDAVHRYTGDRYTQHSTGVADGAEGFIAFFEPFIQRNPDRDIRIVRAFEDGRYVFVQAYQSLNGGESRWVTTDLFDTDEQDRIVEHWDVISPVVDTTVSGHTQIDGPTEISDRHQTDANKAVVREFLIEVLQKGCVDRIGDFVSSDTYIQHNPLAGDGIEGVQTFRSPELGDHGLRGVDAVHVDAGRCKWKSDAASAHRELEDRSVSGQPADELDAVLPIGRVRMQLVVHIGPDLTVLRGIHRPSSVRVDLE